MLAGLDAASLHAEYYEEYLHLTRYLDEVTIVTDNVKSMDNFGTQKLKVIKLPAIRIPKIYGLTKILFYCLATLITKNKYDIIYVRTFSPPELFALWIAKRLLGAKSVLVLPGTWLFGAPNEKISLKVKIFRWILRKALYAADYVVLYSRLMLPEVCLYAPRLRTNEKKIVIIRNAVNTQRFRPGIPLSKEYQSFIDSSDYILYVGRINEKKGVGDLVKSLNKEILGEAKLVLAGKGEPEYLRALREEIERRGIRKNVIHLGEVPNRELPSIMSNARFMVYATKGGEGIPRAILECMACGRPAIATRVAGIPDAVRHLQTGILVEPNDVASLGDWIGKLLRDPQLAEKLGQASRELIEKEFSYESVIPKLVNLFNYLANQPKA